MKGIVNMIAHRIKQLVWLNPVATEVMSVFMAVGWILAVYLGHVFGNPVSDMVRYEHALSFASIWVWVWAFSAIAILQMLSLWENHNPARRACAAVASIMWFTLALFIFQSGWSNPDAWAYFIMGIGSSWAFAQIKRHE